MTLYFAYGTNMDRSGMRQRCPVARAIGIARLEGWRLVVMREGYVSIAQEADGCVHGVLWRVGPSDLTALDAYEAVDAGLYYRRTLPVLADRRTQSAQVYVGGSTDNGQPRPGHLPLVIAAAESWSLPPAYLDQLRHLASP